MKAREILIAVAIKNKGNWENTYKDIMNKVYPSEEEISKTKDIQCITLLDEEYPDKLKRGYKPPFVLFYKGNIELLKSDNIIAVIGTRTPKQKTLDFTEKFVSKQTDKVIITTDANGIAEKVRKATRRAGVKTIVVLGGSLDYKEVVGDLIISEYPLNTTPNMENYPFRNRIVAQLANQVCVMDLKEHSGNLITISNALSAGKNIYVVPDIEEEDSKANELIDEGAYCLTLATTLE